MHLFSCSEIEAIITAEELTAMTCHCYKSWVYLSTTVSHHIWNMYLWYHSWKITFSSANQQLKKKKLMKCLSRLSSRHVFCHFFHMPNRGQQSVCFSLSERLILFQCVCGGGGLTPALVIQTSYYELKQLVHITCTQEAGYHHLDWNFSL